ncbi:MAG TPA: proton-conducting transporter membrane subunit, partial [candidate division Zixibacteria bacterium]|nr:proton-conducting transporter membrane subunit [candidate division Zixibacteria bacterium]
ALLTVTLLVTLTGAATGQRKEREPAPLFFSAALFCAGGLMFLASAYDIFTLFIGIELSVFPLYTYLYTAATAQPDNEAARQRFMRVFLFGAFGSLLLAFGLAILYSLSGVTELIQMRVNLSVVFLSFRKIGPALLVAMVLCACGLGAKIGLAPLNGWLGDIKDNRPAGALPLALLGGAVAGLIGITRLFNNGLIAFSDPVMSPLDWPPILLTLFSLTVALAAVATLREQRLNRLVLWLVLAQAGFALIGVSLYNTDGLSAAFFHIFCAALAGALALSLLELCDTGDGEPRLESLTGFGRCQPLPGATLAIALLSLAALPLTGGFIARTALLEAALYREAWWALSLGLLATILLAVSVGRTLLALYRPHHWESERREPALSLSARVIGALTAATLIYLGIAPESLMAISRDVAQIFAL